MKKLKSLGFVFVLVFTITIIIGCDGNNEQSKATSSTKSSITTSSATTGTKSSITTSAATSNTVSLTESELRQRTMKLEYLKFYSIEDKSLIKELSIKSYGVFGDYEAVKFRGLGASDEEIYIEVSGYEFYFPSSEKLFIFDGKTLTEFNKAFEKGMLTLFDIEILQKQFKPYD